MTKDEFIERYGIEKYQQQLEQGRKRARKWYQDNTERAKETQKQWREENLDYHKQWYQDNSEHKKEYQKQWHQENPDYNSEYRKTPMGRAVYLVQGYKNSDEKHNRGECTLTPKWIIENIFNSKCIYCGETDWQKLGCDRIDNSKPHTLDNVVCACWDCNRERKTTSFQEFVNRRIRESA